ncbi:MAG: amylo-alpha-1,6-glucosidase [Acidobacteria bacterium]|nr:MAG: amylo-alpha-1,6-glucosidase [Acidobacteriota bacterium]
MESRDTPRSDLIRLQTRPHQLNASQSRTVLICDREGMITDVDQHGVFIHETRVLSRLVWNLQHELYTVEASTVHQNSILVYAIAQPQRRLPAYSGATRHKGHARGATEETIELRLATVLSDGLHQDADITNFTIQEQLVQVRLELDADFAGLDEVLSGERRQKGSLLRQSEHSPELIHLRWSYKAHHRGCHLERGVELRLHGVPAGARLDRHGVRWQVRLAPGATAHVCLELAARIEKRKLEPARGCYQLEYRDPRQTAYLEATTQITPRPQPLSTVERAVERARHDLASLRLFDLDRADGWVPAAGIPNYVATFGRDILTAAWQSALLAPDILRGSLQVLRELQGQRTDNWRDEQPGKMLHEAHTGPLSVLNYRPQGRYYGSFNTSPFYVIVLSEFLHWTGDKATMLQHLDAARRTMVWMDRDGHPGPKHFYAFTTRSSQGVKNQGWKDSGDALIYPDGSIVPDPIATCEIQGYAYEAKLRMAELLFLAGERAEAARMLWQAHELKKRFNDVFWMPQENYFAMALDPRGRQVRSIGSDPGDALATGIIARDYVQATVDRLFAPDMFTEWGIRTLSSGHIAFNPYSYHRGSVWPAENAAIGVGLRRYGHTGHLAELMRAQMAIAERFQFVRFPEVMCGHRRSQAQPFPPVYPQSCSPQAWSAGAPVIFLQMLLGIYPYAPMEILFLDPHLPDWFPHCRLERLRVGQACLDIDFERTESGESRFQVTERSGHVRIIRQPSPWSVFASPQERIEDFVASLWAA